METHSHKHRSHIIEMCGDVPEEGKGGIKFCEGVPCGFSDSKTSDKDARERSASMRELLIEFVLCIIFMSVEVVGGIEANSLAILTDTAHLLLDVADFAISLFSLWASGWEVNPRHSYGFFRIEIIRALVSIQLSWLLAGILVYKAIDRLIHETGEVQGFLMFLVAAFGLIVNIIRALLLGHDHGHGQEHCHWHGGHGDSHEHGTHTKDIIYITHHHEHDEGSHEWDPREPILKNGDGAKRKKDPNIHVLGDSIHSVVVMVGGAIVWYKPEWKIIDLICTLIFSVIVLGTTIRKLRNIVEVLMESTPREIDATKLEKGLCEMDEVVAIHELHIWAITVGKVLLACHVRIKPDADADMVLDKVIGYIRREYNISHVTIQIERD